MLSSEALLAASTSTPTTSEAGLTATSTVFKKSRVLFIEALAGPTTRGPAGSAASPAWPPPTEDHCESQNSQTPETRLDTTAKMLETRVLQQCEPIEVALGSFGAPSRPDVSEAGDGSAPRAQRVNAPLAPFTQDAREVIFEALSSAEGKVLFAKLLAPTPTAASPPAPPPSASAPDTAVEATTGAVCFMAEPSENVEDLAPLPAGLTASPAGLSEPNWADVDLNWALCEPSCPATPEVLYHSEESADVDSVLDAPVPAASGRARLRREQYQRARARACTIITPGTSATPSAPSAVAMVPDEQLLPDVPCHHPRCRRRAHSSRVFLGKRYCCGACPCNPLYKESTNHGPICQGRLLQRWFLRDDGLPAGRR